MGLQSAVSDFRKESSEKYSEFVSSVSGAMDSKSITEVLLSGNQGKQYQVLMKLKDTMNHIDKTLGDFPV